MGLTAQQKNDLVEFLKSLPAEGPQVTESNNEPEARVQTPGTSQVQLAQMGIGSSPLAAALLGGLFALTAVGALVQRRFVR